VKRVLVNALIVLTVAAMLVPVVLPVLQGSSPFLIAHTRVWVRNEINWNHIGSRVAVEIPDGSGFRALVQLPGGIVFLLCAAFPLTSLIYLWRKTNGREPQLIGTLLTLYSAWLYWAMFAFAFDYGRVIFGVLGVLAIVGAIAIAVTRSITRSRVKSAGQCAHCGYNLTGNVSGVCPECGMKIALADAPAPAAPWPVITNEVDLSR